MNRPTKLVSALAAGTLALGLTAGAAAADATTTPARHAQPHLTSSQVQRIESRLATDAGRAQVFGGLADSFGAVLADGPADTGRRAPGPQDLSFGFNRDHAWVIASYSDIARGVITAGVVACKRYVPALPFLCDHIGRVLKDLARGYAPVSNHGVWAELYLNGRVRAGRY